jgi:biopolymer transport protein ExbB
MNSEAMPELARHGGLIFWLLLAMGALAVGVFLERLVYFHRENINSTDFLNGIRTVIKRGNVVEALSICDATPGPVARLVKAAILARDRARAEIRETLQVSGLSELPKLEERLGLLATIAQTAPILGLLGTILGLMQLLQMLQTAGLSAPAGTLVEGVWRALVCSGVGLAISAPSYAAYNFLVNRVRLIVLDMEKASSEIVTILGEAAS